MSDPDDDEPELPSQQTTVDAGDQRQVREAEINASMRARRSREFWRGVLSSDVGRAEVWALLQDAHAFDEKFAVGPSGFPQPEHTWFMAGEQAFGYRLFLTMMRHDRENVALMLAEHEPRVVPIDAPAQKPRRSRKTPTG